MSTVRQTATSEGYAHPEVIVDTNWVLDHISDPKVRIAEVDYDPTSNYNQGHIPNSALFDWKKDINDPVRRDILSKQAAEDLLSRNGVSNDTTLVLYGDFNNWFAAFAFWVLKYYGVKDVRLMNGGRKKWIEEDKLLVKDTPLFQKGSFKALDPDQSVRVYLDDVKRALENKRIGLVDVRGPKEFSGEILAPPEYPTEHAQRGGHIPGAVNIPWAQAVKEDGTFKPREELEQLYKPKGITPDREVITYCRIGERSSHTWFVLKYLLGYPDVRNYDGSWTEWGNQVRLPIEK
ncbi:MAG TPA: sulfurtransferase [Nitrososphaerales archaeon]|nr:sulfurtransferase [Nitrososphaerales archaeon]